ncbi:MAG: hypothetical protein JWN37_163 [Candidatus Nomurabacteria bacterium]|nr:hypothetical protein [Candidatus Nomurabacteria bacterium]
MADEPTSGGPDSSGPPSKTPGSFSPNKLRVGGDDIKPKDLEKQKEIQTLIARRLALGTKAEEKGLTVDLLDQIERGMKLTTEENIKLIREVEEAKLLAKKAMEELESLRNKPSSTPAGHVFPDQEREREERFRPLSSQERKQLLSITLHIKSEGRKGREVYSYKKSRGRKGKRREGWIKFNNQEMCREEIPESREALKKYKDFISENYITGAEAWDSYLYGDLIKAKKNLVLAIKHGEIENAAVFRKELIKFIEYYRSREEDEDTEEEATDKEQKDKTPESSVEKSKKTKLRIFKRDGKWYFGGGKRGSKELTPDEELTDAEYANILSIIKEYDVLTAADTPEKQQIIHLAYHMYHEVKNSLVKALEAGEFKKGKDVAKKLHEMIENRNKEKKALAELNLEVLRRGAPSPKDDTVDGVCVVEDITGVHKIDAETGAWIDLTPEELKLYKIARNAIIEFKTIKARGAESRESIEKKNEILNLLNQFDFAGAANCGEDFMKLYAGQVASNKEAPTAQVDPSSLVGATYNQAPPEKLKSSVTDMWKKLDEDRRSRWGAPRLKIPRTTVAIPVGSIGLSDGTVITLEEKADRDERMAKENEEALFKEGEEDFEKILAKHQEMVLRNPQKYVEIYANKTFRPGEEELKRAVQFTMINNADMIREKISPELQKELGLKQAEGERDSVSSLKTDKGLRKEEAQALKGSRKYLDDTSFNYNHEIEKYDERDKEARAAAIKSEMGKHKDVKSWADASQKNKKAWELEIDKTGKVPTGDTAQPGLYKPMGSGLETRMNSSIKENEEALRLDQLAEEERREWWEKKKQAVNKLLSTLSSFKTRVGSIVPRWNVSIPAAVLTGAALAGGVYMTQDAENTTPDYSTHSLEAPKKTYSMLVPDENRKILKSFESPNETVDTIAKNFLTTFTENTSALPDILNMKASTLLGPAEKIDGVNIDQRKQACDLISASNRIIWATKAAQNTGEVFLPTNPGSKIYMPVPPDITLRDYLVMVKSSLANAQKAV